MLLRNVGSYLLSLLRLVFPAEETMALRKVTLRPSFRSGRESNAAGSAQDKAGREQRLTCLPKSANLPYLRSRACNRSGYREGELSYWEVKNGERAWGRLREGLGLEPAYYKKMPEREEAMAGKKFSEGKNDKARGHWSQSQGPTTTKA